MSIIGIESVTSRMDNKMYEFRVVYGKKHNKFYMIGTFDTCFTRWMDQRTRPTKRQLRKFKNDYYKHLFRYF